MYDVVIIGAGVVGGMIARELSAFDVKVCIIDKENDVAMGASKANSGIVHAGFDAQTDTLKARLNVRGSELMPKVTRELGVKYKQNGSMVVGFDENDKKIIDELYQRGCDNGVKDLKILDKKQIQKIEKHISADVCVALYAPTGAIVCPYELTIAAIGNAMDNGVELKLNYEVSDIVEKNGVYQIFSKKNMIETKSVINAAGVHADKIAAMAGACTFSINPRKGEYILLDKECGNMTKHTIFQTPSKSGKGILVSPTVDGNLLLGPTAVDIEDKDDKSVTKNGFEEIIKKVYRSLKDIPYQKIITSFCGVRSVGNTGDFIIEAPKPGFYNVAGIESPGLSASPAIAEYVVQILKKNKVITKKNPDYNPIRKSQHFFRDASIEEKNNIIKQKPAFGKIICRCELITEGEILHAIHTNPKATDLDGVKRRTRAQMGRCQGGFCSPQVVEILARELNIPYEKVTKFGKQSYINVGKTKFGNDSLKCDSLFETK